MVDHLVLFKPKPGTPPEIEEELVRQLLALRERIPGIVAMSCGRNFSSRNQGYTVGYWVRFRDREALEAYSPHPEHQRVVAFTRTHFADVLIVDYPWEPSEGQP